MLSVSYLQLVMSASAAPGTKLLSFLPGVLINLVETTVILTVQELHTFYPPIDCHWRNEGLPEPRCLATHKTWGIQHPLI